MKVELEPKMSPIATLLPKLPVCAQETGPVEVTGLAQ